MPNQVHTMAKARRFQLIFDRQELEKIAINEISSVTSKAKIISLIAIAHQQGILNTSPDEPKAKADSSESEDAVATQIADWICATWSEKTVRAKMAQKIAALIREGAWRE